MINKRITTATKTVKNEDSIYLKTFLVLLIIIMVCLVLAIPIYAVILENEVEKLEKKIGTMEQNHKIELIECRFRKEGKQ